MSQSSVRRDNLNRVLVTGGAGTIGAAVVRRLLRDAAWEVRVSDYREAPVWMREGCEVHAGDLRQAEVARQATSGCTHVIHLAAIVGGIANFHKLPFTLTEVNNALTGAVAHAAIDESVERFVYVSSSMVFERATEFPTTEVHLLACPPPKSAYGFSKLSGEVYARAAHEQHGLPYTICRPFNAYGPGELPRDEPGIAHAVPDLIAKVLAGQRPLQIFGSGALGGAQAELLAVPAADFLLLKIPEGINTEQALLLTDNLATGWAAGQRADIPSGGTVALIGLGAVGLCALRSAFVQGAATIFAVDRVDGIEHGDLDHGDHPFGRRRQHMATDTETDRLVIPVGDDVGARGMPCAEERKGQQSLAIIGDHWSLPS